MSGGVDSVIDELSKRLDATKLPSRFNGVEFTGKSLKLNNAEDAKPIVDAINNLEGPLEYLNLEGNTVGVEAATAIANALENKPTLRVAWWKDMFTSRSKEEIPIALRALSKSLIKAGARLMVLELSDNASGPIGVDGISELISSQVCWGLEELRMANMGLGITGAQKLAAALEKCLADSTAAGSPLALKVFIAGRNRLENAGSSALAEVLKKIGTLEEIQIYQNAIYHPGIRVLSDAFSHNSSLRVLNLNDNTITRKGAVHLSEALKNLPNLDVLNLGDCLLRSSGARIIAPVLKDLHKLVELDLSSNEIGAGAAEEIVQSLENKKHLKILRVGANVFGSQDKSLEKSIRRLCGSNPGFTLSMSDNESGSEEEDDDEGSDEDREKDGDSEGEEELQDEYDYDDEDDEDDEGDSDEYSGDEYSGILNTTSPMRRDYNQPTLKSVEIDTSLSSLLKQNQIFSNSNTYDQVVNKLAGLPVQDQIDELLTNIAKLLPATDVPNDLVNRLFRKLFEVADTSSSSALVNNLLPAYVGLVKCEKDTIPIKQFDYQKSAKVLQKVMTEDFFPQNTKDIITFLLDRPQEMNNN